VPAELTAPAPASTADGAAPPPEGWQVGLKVGSNVSLTNATNVVGSADGTSIQIGLILQGNANLRSGQHEWQNQLDINHQQTRTPLIHRFLKTADEATAQSMYLYHLQAVPWLGPFARGRGTTSLFPGDYVQADDKTIQRTYNDGTVETGTLPAGRSLRLTKAFEPTLLRESLGVFARPVEQKDLQLDFKLGGGAQHLLTRDGFTVKDDPNTDPIEIVQLRDSTQAGIEGEAAIRGPLEGGFTWSASINALYPLLTSVDTNLEGIDLMNVEGNAKLSLKLTEWGSVDYVFSAKRIPLIVNRWQIQNGLLFNASFNLI
jgi:hypothetical protein